MAFFLQRLESLVIAFLGACGQWWSYVGLVCNQLVQIWKKYPQKIKGLAVCGVPMVVNPGNSG